ncbi:hypothetical protein Tco_0929901 [Tanacetum coccineum]
MSLMIMKNSISVAIRGSIPNSKNAKEFLKSVEEQFKGSSKANASTLILKMLTTKYNGLSEVHEHIMMMNDMASKLNGMDMAISEFSRSFNNDISPNTTIIPSDDVVDIHVVDAPPHDQIPIPPIVQQPLRRSERIRRPVVHDDFITYLNEDDYDLELPNGVKTVGCFLLEKFEMNNLEEASYLIGIEIYRDRSRGRLGLSQRGDKFGAYQCPKNKLEQEEMRVKPYAYVVGSLTYAQVRTRPDIAYITEVVGYSDSNFAKCKDSSRSTSRYIFMLSGGPISWRSHKQELTTTSNMMAEHVACYHATSHAILLKNLIYGLKVVDFISRPLRLYCDNSSAVRFSNNTNFTGAGLYLETKYLYVQEKVEDNSIVIEYINTHDMLTDPLTKGLPSKLFLEHVASMGLCDNQI